mgnify:CR=1 FL=1
MENKGFADDQSSIETPNDASIAEKPLKSSPIRTNRVDINVLKSKLQETEDKECKYDPGGYFIVNGNEKVIMSVEKMVDNKILVFTKKDNSFDNNKMYMCQVKNILSCTLDVVPFMKSRV